MDRAVEAVHAWVPRWWGGAGGARGAALRVALAPAEAVFRLAAAGRNLAYDHGWARAVRPHIPVISVGNIAVGGAGKTPVTAWLAGRLAGYGASPAIVVRGYGEDEIAVHRELNPGVPVLAAVRRAEAVEAAARAGRDVAVLDDGFQHRSIARDLDIVLIAAETWSTTRRLLPRGPWREPATALRRADLLIVTRKSAPLARAREVAAECGRIAPGVPAAVLHLRPTRLRRAGAGAHSLDWLSGRDVLAVASLADPRPFVEQLTASGARVELLAFPDHHAFTDADVARVTAVAGARAVICTRKEAVKLEPVAPPWPFFILDQEVVVEDGGGTLDAAIQGVLPS